MVFERASLSLTFSSSITLCKSKNICCSECNPMGFLPYCCNSDRLPCCVDGFYTIGNWMVYLFLKDTEPYRLLSDFEFIDLSPPNGFD